MDLLLREVEVGRSNECMMMAGVAVVAAGDLDQDLIGGGMDLVSGAEAHRLFRGECDHSVTIPSYINSSIFSSSRFI
jgi:hypothetical protein